jgi:hypothetical protein
MLAHILLILRLLFVSPAEGAALASTAPAYLDADRAADHLRWARLAGTAFDVDPSLLLATAWHESRYSAGEVTRESQHRVSCGVMTPVPHRAPCSAWELSVRGGYWEGAQHLRTWLNICRGRDHTHDTRYARCAVLAYAGGGWLVKKCAHDGVAEVRPGVDACALFTQYQVRSRWIRRALASLSSEGTGTGRGSRVTMSSTSKYTCDGCGKEASSKSAEGWSNPFLNHKRYDLCPSCTHKALAAVLHQPPTPSPTEEQVAQAVEAASAPLRAEITRLRGECSEADGFNGALARRVCDLERDCDQRICDLEHAVTARDSLAQHVVALEELCRLKDHLLEQTIRGNSDYYTMLQDALRDTLAIARRAKRSINEDRRLDAWATQFHV